MTGEQTGFFHRLREDETYKSVFVNPWTYVLGATLLALLNIAELASVDKAWGVTTSMRYWAGWIYEGLGGDASGWLYWAEVKKSFTRDGFGFFTDVGSITNLGIIAGALLATLLASQFKVKKMKNSKQVWAATLGGLLMGFGACVAFGCNIGALFSAVPELSLQGWVFMVGIFGGAYVGSKLLVKYFI